MRFTLAIIAGACFDFVGSYFAIRYGAQAVKSCSSTIRGSVGSGSPDCSGFWMRKFLKRQAKDRGVARPSGRAFYDSLCALPDGWATAPFVKHCKRLDNATPFR